VIASTAAVLSLAAAPTAFEKRAPR